jgi:hypothetical protein
MNIIERVQRAFAGEKPRPTVEGMPELPEWAAWAEDEDGLYVAVDPNVVYPMWLDKLGVGKAARTQYWLEVARRCFTEALKERLAPSGVPLERLRILKGEAWRLVNFPAGEGEQAGSLGFRTHWLRLKREGKA